MKRILVLTLLMSLLSAQTAEILRDEVAHTAKQYAQGGTSIATNASPTSAYSNPALLNKLSAFQFHAVSMFNNTSEDRKYPAYSAFDSRNGNEVYASTDLSYANFNFALSGEFTFKDQRYVAAFARVRTFDNNYFYREIVRKNSASQEYLMGAQILENKGEIFANTFALASEYKKVKMGISLAFYSMNTFEQNKEVRLSAQSEANPDDYDNDLLYANISRVEFELDNTPVSLNLGLTYPVLDQLTLGVAFRSGYTAELRGNGVANDYSMPQQIAFGLEYYGSNSLAAKFSFDYEFVNWADLSIEDPSSGLNLNHIYANVHRYKFGMEHKVGENSTPLRVGAIFENLKSDPDVHKTTFTLGTSVKASIIDVDFAMGYSYVTYNERDVFPDAIWINPETGLGYPERNGLDTVDRNFLNVMIDLTYNFEL